MARYLIGAAWFISLAVAIVLSYGAGEQRREAGAAIAPKAFEIVTPLTGRQLRALEAPDLIVSPGWVAARPDTPSGPQPHYAVLPLPDDYRPAEPARAPAGGALIELPPPARAQSEIQGCGCWTEAGGARRCGCWD
jgi:hypothetical protein